MERALYDPETGYYPRREAKKDFFTAPELHPAFAGVLTREIVKRLESLRDAGVCGPYTLLEMGSGTGLLARQILQSLQRYHPEWASQTRYVLVERCRDVLLDSIVALSDLHQRLLGCSRMADVPPCAGVFFSNELVDALPVHLLEKKDGAVHEVYVDGTVMKLGALSKPELERHASELPEGSRHAVNLSALRWLADVSEKLTSGFLITIDYGSRYPRGAANPARAFDRHFTDDRLLAGADITANVDFEALIEEGGRLGMKLESYGTMSRFLLERGIDDWMNKGEGAESFKERAKIKTLIHPDGMGESFKVLIQRKGL